MLSEKEIRDIVKEYGLRVNEGRSIEELIADNELPRLKGCTVLQGKVSDSVIGPSLTTKSGIPIRLMFRNNRISTHDVNRGLIPFKDQVLAQNHAHMLNIVKYVLGTSQFTVPGLLATSTVIPAENLQLIPMENVIRMYMAESSTSTSLYQHWLKARQNGEKWLSYAGHHLETGMMKPNERLPYVLDTPSTKDKSDKTVSPGYFVENNLMTTDQYQQIRNGSIMAFGMVSQYLQERNMILVDTKTEHGVNHRGQIVVADEVYTMDSSRFWKLDDTGKLITEEGKPVSFSKEFARGMVTEKGMQFTVDQVNQIAVRYISGLQLLTGKTFKADLRPRDQRIVESVNLILDHLL